MSNKLEKLTQRLQDSQEFIATHFSEHPSAAKVQASLQAIAQAVQTPQPILHLWADTSTTTQLGLQVLQTIPEVSQHCQTQTSLLSDWSTKSEIDCDILCIVVPSVSDHLETLKPLLAYLNPEAIAQCLIMVNTPPETFSTSDNRPQVDVIDAEISQIKRSLNDATTTLNLNVAIVSLDPLLTHATTAKSASRTRPKRSTRRRTNADLTETTELDSPEPISDAIAQQWQQIQKQFEGLLKRKPEDLVAKRLSLQVLTKLNQLDACFDDQVRSLNETIQTNQTAIAQLQTDHPDQQQKQQFDQKLQTLTNHQTQFFKQVKQQILQSKAEILDEFNRRSITHQIQRFIDQLQPSIVRRGQSRYIQLKSEQAYTATDINMDIMQLCYGYLSQWSTDEWRHIYSIYGDGGLSQMFQSVRSLMQQVPALESDIDHVQPTRSLPTVGKGFRDLVASTSCEVFYKEVSVFNYLIRQMRNQWMGIMFLLTFITMIGLGGGNKRELISGLFAPILNLKDQPVWLFIVLAAPLCLIFTFLMNSYHNDSQIRVEDEAEKLKKNLRTYYQSFSKNLTDKLVQDFDRLLELEEARLQKLLTYLSSKGSECFANHEQQQSAIQQTLDQLLSQRKSIEKTKSEFQRLKRL